jgi:hypothetical protein
MQIIMRTARKIARTVKAAWQVARHHLPKWVAVAFVLCLAIPGPLDELAMLIVIGAMAALKPAMRREMSASIRSAWSA